MPKITVNLQISQKKKTKKKTKRKTKKYKGKIGRDLIKDTIGSNQLLDFNDLNNLLKANQSIKPDDKNKYSDYIDNLRAQQTNQLYGGDPNEQYQLKKVSKKLYNNFKNSLFGDVIRQDNIIGPPPDDEPVISNSWDAIPGGTATSIGSARPSFISSFVEPVENIGSSSSVQIVDAYNFPTADIVSFDPLAYMKQEIRNKLSKDIYQIAYPSDPTIVKWFAPIKKKINDEGFTFGENYKQVVRDVYTELYPNAVKLIRTPVKKTPEQKKDLIKELMNDSSDVPIGTVAKSKKTPAKTTPAKTTPSKTPAKKTPVKTTPAKTPEQKAQELKEYRKKYYQENKDKFKPKSKK